MTGRRVLREVGRGVVLAGWIVLTIGYYATMGILIGLALVAGRGRA